MDSALPAQAGQKNFDGLSVASFENRMAKEMEDLIRRNGGVPKMAPAAREIPLSENQEAFSFFEKLERGELDLVIFLTGVGTKALFQTLESQYSKDRVLKAFQKIPRVARGPKPVKALNEYGVPADIIVPEPNTWREVMATLESQKPVFGLRVAVQEYGVSNPDFIQALRDKGAVEVLQVPVYRWALPEDLKPLTRLIDSILLDEIQVVLITSAVQIHNLFHVAKGLGLENRLRDSLSKTVLASIGPMATEALESHQLSADLEPEHPKMGFLVKEAAAQSKTLLEGKNFSRVQPSSSVSKLSPRLRESIFMKACRREKTERTPLWIMRQAGRYLPEYRQVRSKVSFLELCKTPELACEVTVKAQEVLGVDAAILFADILLIAEPLGLQLEFKPDHGPVIHNPIRKLSDVKGLKDFQPEKDLQYVLKAVQLIRSSLKPDIPLIGFAGSPFTLASYLIEGGSSPDHAKTRALLNEDPSLWESLMEKLVTATAGYLGAQVNAGAQALQLFDSWVGRLSNAEFEKGVLPYLRRLIPLLPSGVPLIYFGTQTAPFFPQLKSLGASVIGVDWRTPLDEAWNQLGDVALQGNLNPETLLTDPGTVRRETENILKLVGGRPGHIFNLGHGILPETPMENVRAMVETVKGWKKP